MGNLLPTLEAKNFHFMEMNYIFTGRFSEPKSCRANGARMMGFSKKRFSMSRFSPDTAVADADEVCL